MVVAATGDDKANVVLSLLAKTEFAVPRVVARVNDPRNEWLFTDAWGVDVAVSTPRMLASLIEEAVAVGDLVRLMEFRKGQANLVEITLPDDTPWGGKPVRKLQLPRDAALVTILRGPRVIVPQDDEPLEGGDELLFVAVTEAEEELRQLLLPRAVTERRPSMARCAALIARKVTNAATRGQRPAHRDPRHHQPAGLVGVVEQPLHHEPGAEHQHPGQRGDVERVDRPAHVAPAADHVRAAQPHM